MNINRIPEPALIRSSLVAVTGILALILGHAIDVSWIDTVTTVYAALSPLVAGLLIRPAVVPLVTLAAPSGGEGDSSAGMATTE